MLALKRRKTGLVARVSTLCIPGLGQPNGLCCLPDGQIMASTQNSVVVFYPGGFLPCTVFAGTRFRGFMNGSRADATFDHPSGLVICANGDLVVVDTKNHALRLVVKEVAGSSTVSSKPVRTFAGAEDPGFADGFAVDRLEEDQALFDGPTCAVLLEGGDLAILDTGNHALRLLTPKGVVSTLAGWMEPGFRDGAGRNARFCFPSGLALDFKNKRLIVSDTGNHAIRMVSMQGIVSTIAGDGLAGFVDDVLANARFSSPTGVVVDGCGKIVVADTGNNRIRAIELPGVCVTTLAGGEDHLGSVSTQQADGLSSEARFKDPSKLALDCRGRLLVTENNRVDAIRIVDAGLLPPVCLYKVDHSILLNNSSVDACLLALEHFGTLLEDSAGDVVFVVGAERFPAHRAIVSSRCTYLASLVAFRDGNPHAQEEFVIEHVSADAFRVIRHFIYTAEMPSSLDVDAPSLNSTEGAREVPGRSHGIEVAREVLMTADMWRIEDLYEHCLREFDRSLAISNCVEALVWAITQGTAATRRISVAFFAKNRSDVQRGAPDTMDLIKDLSREQTQELLLAVLRT